MCRISINRRLLVIINTRGLFAINWQIYFDKIIGTFITWIKVFITSVLIPLYTPLIKIIKNYLFVIPNIFINF